MRRDNEDGKDNISYVSIYDVAAKQIDCIMLDAAPKEVGENNFHYEQHQQRREQAPCYPKHCPFVFLFKITFHQFLKKKLMLFQFLKHRYS